MVMDCDFISKMKKIDEYVLGELPDYEKEAFEKHIFECDSCFKQLKIRKEMVHLIQEEGDVLFAEFIEPKKKPAKERENVQVFRFPRFGTKFRPAFARTLLRKNLVPVYASAVLFFILVGSFFTYQNFIKKDFWSQYCYDDQVPYEYPEKTDFVLRSSNNETDVFKNNFDIGMLKYKECNYLDAIGYWQVKEQEVEKLQESLENEESLSLLRDYYFYYGVSCFAAARSTQKPLSEEKQKNAYQKSSQLLSTSKKLTTEHQLDHLDRDLYYLALATGFSGNANSALSILQKIAQDSPFYSRANKLKDSLEN